MSLHFCAIRTIGDGFGEARGPRVAARNVSRIVLGYAGAASAYGPGRGLGPLASAPMDAEILSRLDGQCIDDVAVSDAVDVQDDLAGTHWCQPKAPGAKVWLRSDEKCSSQPRSWL